MSDDRIYYLLEPCATSDAFEIKFWKPIELKKAASALGKLGEVLAETPAVLVMKSGKASLSVYATGRVIAKNVTRKETKELAEKIHGLLSGAGAYAD